MSLSEKLLRIKSWGSLGYIFAYTYEVLPYVTDHHSCTRTMNIHFIQHVPFLGPGAIKTWAEARHNHVSNTRMFKGEELPDPALPDALIVLGGDLFTSGGEPTMEQKREKKFIRSCIQMNKMVLGINLGARLIASSLGSRILPGRYKKVGWYQVTWNSQACKHPVFNFIPCRHMVLYWHQHTYRLPVGAVRLAGSYHCKNQAFMYGNTVLGLQFHLEIDHAGLQQMVAYHQGELKERGPHIQSAEHILSRPEYLDAGKRILDRILDLFFLRELDAARGMTRAC